MFLLIGTYSEAFLCLDSGKTALAATVGIDSDFPYVKIVSPICYFVYDAISPLEIPSLIDSLFIFSI